MTTDSESIMFIEPTWQDSLISLLIAINGSLGAADRATALRPLTPTDVVAIAHAISQKSYKPDHWFGVGGISLSQRQPISSVEPPIQPEARYAAVMISAEPSGREMISSRSGGLLFDDPFYAILAAYNISKAPKRSDLSVGFYVEVKTSSRDLTWARRQAIVQAIATGTYLQDRYFSVSGPIHVTRQDALWHAGELPGDQMTKLVSNGASTASFSGGIPQVYGLYRYVSPTP